jgi:exo-beta-1,3-glucanase (GH17 family)
MHGLWSNSPFASVNADTGYATEAHNIGINYGTLGNNLPAPSAAVAAIKSMKIGRVKIFNPDAGILAALANSGLEAVVAIPNDQFGAIGTSAATAEAWIAQNVAVYYPATNIVTILVGNEVFSDASLPWASLVPAMQNLQTSLSARGWSDKIKVSTAVAADVLSSSYPPSAGTFRADIAVPYILPLLKFLSTTNSYFFVNLYPFLAYTTSAGAISLSYATFATDANTVVDGSLTYTNLLDAQLDAVISGMEKLGVTDVRVAVGETGWPTKGDATQTGASIQNAASYNRRLVRKILATSGGGTPKRPDVFIPTFIFALFNENLKPGPESERNWGLLYPNLQPVYAIDLTGQTLDSQYAPIP